jgi:RNA polymerase sigma factor (sigma-70 family)
VELYRRHVLAQKRSVKRERFLELGLPEQSSVTLAAKVAAKLSSPSRQALKKEKHAIVMAALERLGESYREVLVLRYLEQLSTAEAAAVLGIPEGTVKIRLLRALERLRALLDRELAEG